MQYTRKDAPEIQVGSIISFTNRVGYFVVLTVTRVEEKSWYNGGRNSYGTLLQYAKGGRDVGREDSIPPTAKAVGSSRNFHETRYLLIKNFFR